MSQHKEELTQNASKGKPSKRSLSVTNAKGAGIPIPVKTYLTMFIKKAAWDAEIV